MKRPDIILTVGTLALAFFAGLALAATGMLEGFLLWAWERHHNVLSWYIRPLFILPLVYFSYRRSLPGIVLTLVALATSMFWFPAPQQADPTVEEFLAFEREWLTGGWTLAKVLMTSVVPLSLAALCLAFWKRSLVWGLVIINAVAIGKVLWGVVSGEGTGWAMLLPAIAGLLVCDAVVLYAARRIRAKSSRHGRPTLVAATKDQVRKPDGVIPPSEQGRSHKLTTGRRTDEGRS